MVILMQLLSLIKTKTMQQDFQEFENQPAQRPTFLKVLCILTFIFSGYALISSTITYFNAEKVSATIINAREKLNQDLSRKGKDSESAGFASKVMDNMSVMSTPDNLRKTALANIVTSILCLLGAFLMWQLNKKGFYIYLLGTLVGILLPFYLFGGNFLTSLSVGFAGFIGLLFVIFYAMNLKSMK